MPRIPLLSLLLLVLPGVACAEPAPECAEMGVIADFRGLWLDPNPLSKAPRGAARVAMNVISSREGTAECIPGQAPLPGAYDTGSERLRSGIKYGGAYGFEHTGTALYKRDVVLGTLAKVADNQPASGTTGRMRFVVAGDDLYMTTGEGVLVMDGPASTPVAAGLTQPPDIAQAGIYGDVSPGFLAQGASVAYRAVLLRNDAEGRPMLSPPTTRRVLENTDNTVGINYHVELTVGLPADAREGDFIQVYRTAQALGSSNPGDTMYLFHESEITPAVLLAGGLVVVDRTPDLMLGTPLYTNNTAVNGGATMENRPPPYGQELAYFRNSLFVADTRMPHRLLLRLLSVPSSNEITIDGHTYTVPSFPDEGSVSRNIETWARLLITEIIFYSLSNDTGIIPSYVSGESDPPGMISLERTSPTGAQFSIQSSDGTSFVPAISTPVSSTQDVRPNGISISKRGLPYAFPSNSAHHLRLGATDARVLRVMANRDSLFVFKEDGIWRVYEAGNGWGYTQISTDVVLLFPDSVAVMNNQIYFFSNQGLMAVDESGIEQADSAIRPATQAIQDAVLSSSSGPSPASIFAVADSERLRYTLWHASDSSTGTAANHAFVYNGLTDVWTERDDEVTGGYIGYLGLLFLGEADSPTVTRQRNTGTADDYQGPTGGPLNVEIEWIPLINGNPAGQSQFTELRLLTEEATSGDYEFTFRNHYGYSEVATFDGEGLPEVRAWVPDEVQRTTRLGVKVRRSVFQEYLVVLGLADTAEDYNGPPTRG